eukprot:scaffold102547_cov54-Phaeocystis_antarctica.AAC.1
MLKAALPRRRLLEGVRVHAERHRRHEGVRVGARLLAVEHHAEQERLPALGGGGARKDLLLAARRAADELRSA